ncbi:MAG: hypothetical protein E7271_02755 [Lachnospiraceae bacterium]|nr:hypothetical protein [Lachnospiraceae bacterium]
MKSLKRITAVTLTAAMVAGLVVSPVTTTYAAESVEKEETVYVTQTATGDVKSVTVSDWLKNVTGNGEIKDKSTLKDIKNVKGNEEFTENGDSLTWKANDADIYYQGTTNEKPPVAMQVSYKLDGKDIKPEDLAGKSGKVEITIKYINNTSYKDTVDGEETTLQNPFLMASAVILPVDNFSNVEVSQGKLVSEGSNQILVAYGMPGLFDSLEVADDTREKLEKHLSDTVTITADAVDFELSSIYTVATADEFSSIDLDENSDMDDLEDALDKLDDASESLVSGTDTLSEGIGTLKDNFKTYANGVGSLKDGAGSLSKGAGKLSTGITKYTNGVKSVTDGASQFVTGTNSLASGVKAYVAGEKQVAEGAKQLNEGAKDFPAKYSAFSAGLNSYVSGVNAVVANLKTLNDGTADVTTNMETGIGYLKTGNDAIQGLSLDTDYTTSIQALTVLKSNTSLSDTEKGAIAQAIADLTAAATVQGTVKQAAQGIDGGYKTIDGYYSKGVKKIFGGLNQLYSTVDSQGLSSGGTTLIGYDKEISAGITTVTGGIAGLYEGINKLSENNDALTKGADTLEKSGSLLTSGIGQLTSNTKSLTTGAADLSKGAKKLSKGAADLDTATGKVTEGIGKLSDGSDKLSEGMSKFKDEGTDKLKREYNSKVKTVLDRLDSLTGKAGQYKTFSGVADGMDGKVKFIFQTAEIKTEE